MGKTGNRFSGSQKMSAMLSTCPAICERIFGGTLFIFINREDRRYTKKMTYANLYVIFLNFYCFGAYNAFLLRNALRLFMSNPPNLAGTLIVFLRCRAQRRVTN